jgi:hypothetical protein
MNVPLHTFPPRPVRLPVDEAFRRLTGDPQPTVVSATAAALERRTPLLRRWGVVARSLPSVTAEVTGDGGPGVVVIRWRGDEAATGWPAMTARLLLTPTPDGGSELTLATTRHPSLGLAAPTLDRFHRERAVRVLVAAFLEALADASGQAPARTPDLLGAAR